MRDVRLQFVLLATAVAFAAPTFIAAQASPASAMPACQGMSHTGHYAGDHDSHEDVNIGYIPREVLQRPIMLRNNIGHVSDLVTTKNGEAQTFYNQGVAYLHSYVWIDAARSFHQALRLDPNLALAHIGLFRVFLNIEDLPAATEEVNRAEALQASVTDRERRRIAASRKHLEALQDLQDQAKHDAYKKALEDALNHNPEDVELWLLRGNAEEAAADGRGQRGGAGSIAFYEAAMARSPENFAAHHYLIHSYEVIGRNDEAEKHGQRYAELASGIPHAHHMWGHDLRLVGKIGPAIEQFAIASQLEKDWYAADGLDASLDWHRPHNLDLLSRSLQHEGRMREAEQTIREAMQLKPTSRYAGYGQKMLPDFLIARGRHQEALEAAQNMQKSEWALARLEGHVLAGRALLARNNVEAARAEFASAEKEIPEARKDFTGVVTFERFTDDQLNELRGEILLRSGSKDDAKRADDLLAGTAESLASHRGADALAELYLLEHIARVARQQQQWNLAQHTADLMMGFDPNYFGAHYAVAQLATHNGDAPKATQEMAAARALWGSADPGLEELAFSAPGASRAGK